MLSNHPHLTRFLLGVILAAELIFYIYFRLAAAIIAAGGGQ